MRQNLSHIVSLAPFVYNNSVGGAFRCALARTAAVPLVAVQITSIQSFVNGVTSYLTPHIPINFYDCCSCVGVSPASSAAPSVAGVIADTLGSLDFSATLTPEGSPNPTSLGNRTGFRIDFNIFVLADISPDEVDTLGRGVGAVAATAALALSTRCMLILAAGGPPAAVGCDSAARALQTQTSYSSSLLAAGLTALGIQTGTPQSALAPLFITHPLVLPSARPYTAAPIIGAGSADAPALSTTGIIGITVGIIVFASFLVAYFSHCFVRHHRRQALTAHMLSRSGKSASSSGDGESQRFGVTNRSNISFSRRGTPPRDNNGDDDDEDADLARAALGRLQSPGGIEDFGSSSRSVINPLANSSTNPMFSKSNALSLGNISGRTVSSMGGSVSGRNNVSGMGDGSVSGRNNVSGMWGSSVSGRNNVSGMTSTGEMRGYGGDSSSRMGGSGVSWATAATANGPRSISLAASGVEPTNSMLRSEAKYRSAVLGASSSGTGGGGFGGGNSVNSGNNASLLRSTSPSSSSILGHTPSALGRAASSSFNFGRSGGGGGGGGGGDSPPPSNNPLLARALSGRR